MKVVPSILLSTTILTCGACQAVPLAQPPPVALTTRLFGPVIAQQVIRGREDHGDTTSLLVETTIVGVDLKERRVSVIPIRVEPGETCWGLARLTDGSLWTLKGRNAVVRVEASGAIAQVIPLDEPHAGLFASGDRLILQKAVSSAPEPALRAVKRDGGERVTWSALTVRSFPGIARAQASALSLVACGRSALAERPCWFPDEPAISLIAPDGATRRVALDGLAAVAPEVLLTAENPRRPVRDAYVDEQSRIWVLSSGEPSAVASDLPGGWVLGRYRPDGAADGHVRFAEPVRLILRVQPGRVIVLAGTGHVSEVASW